MKLRKVLLPEGVQDLLIDDCIYRRQIEDKFMENFKQSGYMEVSSPALEYYDLFPGIIWQITVITHSNL